jgi:hypothetical protein
VLHRHPLRVQDGEEDASDHRDGGHGHRPPQDQTQDPSFVAVVYVLPDDLPRLGSDCHLDVDALHSEVLDQLILVDPLELLQQLVADLLAVEHDDRLLANDLILSDEPHLLLVLLLELRLLLPDLGVNLDYLQAVVVCVGEELALLGHQPPLLLPDELVVLEDVEQDHVLRLELLPHEGLPQKTLQLLLRVRLAGHVVEDD